MDISESQSFAERLRQALAGIGVRPSPTIVAQEFNQRYKGRNVTTHTVRNWLLGQAIPTQDKLRVLAEWLQVSPDELRFGCKDGMVQGLAQEMQLDMADQEMVRRYLGLPLDARKTVRDVVTALNVAAGQKRASPPQAAGG
jgi:transcriptional regulator with XRE-family HTH domain